MPLQKLKLVLLPGLDGTGELFVDFVKALPDAFEVAVIRYPVDVCLSYAQLAELVVDAIPVSEPFVLLAESFSTPLAIHFAATNPVNLQALVLCAGFASSPVKGWLRFICAKLAPIAFRVAIPDIGIRLLLIGADAPDSLVAAVRAAISSVLPLVISTRVHEVLLCDKRAELERIAAPILYIRGEQDRLVRARCLAEIIEIRPETVVMSLRAAHLLLQREPRQTAEIVANFFQELG